MPMRGTLPSEKRGGKSMTVEEQVKKLSLREQLELQVAENEAIVQENESLKKLLGLVLEDKRIPENVRRDYTKAYIELEDKVEVIGNE